MSFKMEEEGIELGKPEETKKLLRFQTEGIELGKPEETEKRLRFQTSPTFLGETDHVGLFSDLLGPTEQGETEHRGWGNPLSSPIDLTAAGKSTYMIKADERREKKSCAERLLIQMAQRNDFVLVGKVDKYEQQEAFIEELKEKGIKVEVSWLDGNIYYGLQASEALMKDNQCLIEDSYNYFVGGKCLATRIIFVDSILNETKINTGERAEGLEDLMNNGVFETKFSLHEEERKDKQRWAKRLLNELAQRNDFVLVGEKDKKDQQEAFINKLIEKEIKVEKEELNSNIYYGLRAPEVVILEKLHKTFEMKYESTDSEDVTESITVATRVRFVNLILKETKINKGEGLEDLMRNGVFENKICLYEALLMEYYYILVGEEDKKIEQRPFLEELEREDIEIKIIKHGGKRFYGLRAAEAVFKKYQYLLKVSDTCNSEEMNTSVSLATRIRFVNRILNEAKINTKDGDNTGEDLEDLMRNGVFETKFCLYESELKEWLHWNSAFKNQPFQKIRKYFGEKVALYYLWMGCYNYFLIPAAVLGLLVFLCGIIFSNTNPLIKEVCESNITMCPRCEKICEPLNWKDTCTYAKVSSFLDNEATVVFALFMAAWATLLLQFWMRFRVKNVSRWEAYNWREEEEERILEIINDLKHKPQNRKYSTRWVLLLLIVAVMMLVIILVPALVAFRITVRSLLSDSSWQFMRDHTNILVVIFGAVLHHIAIQIMTQINRWVSIKLSKDESKSSSDKESTYTIMMFTFQFLTMFSSLFYIAFFLGRINGYPGNYFRIAGYRLDECHPSGCLTNLFIQMATIMTVSQVLSNIVKLAKPLLMKQWRKVMTTKDIDCCRRKISIPWPKNGSGNESKTDGGEINHPHCWNKQCDNCLLYYWKENYELDDTNDYSLFHEMLNMVIQFSFITLFVAAFPLAPLLALFNNIITIHLDAVNMVRLQRLLVPKKTNVIGLWINVLEAIGVLAVIINSLVIGITSDFIPRFTYLYLYGPCATGVTNTHCMRGYVNSSLTTAYMLVNNTDEFVHPEKRHLFNVTACSFRDYRSSDDHTLTSQFWWVLAARFAFVIAFEHLLLVFKAVVVHIFPSDFLSVKSERMD